METPTPSSPWTGSKTSLCTSRPSSSPTSSPLLGLVRRRIRDPRGRICPFPTSGASPDHPPAVPVEDRCRRPCTLPVRAQGDDRLPLRVGHGAAAAQASRGQRPAPPASPPAGPVPSAHQAGLLPWPPLRLGLAQCEQLPQPPVSARNVFFQFWTFNQFSRVCQFYRIVPLDHAFNNSQMVHRIKMFYI